MERMERPDSMQQEVYEKYSADNRQLYRIAECYGLTAQEVLHSVAVCLQYQRRMMDLNGHHDCAACPFKNLYRPCVFPAGVCKMKGLHHGK